MEFSKHSVYWEIGRAPISHTKLINCGSVLTLHTYLNFSNLLYLIKRKDTKIWCLKFQVFHEDLNSNTELKLFILVWSYEGMERMNLGCEKS